LRRAKIGAAYKLFKKPAKEKAMSTKNHINPHSAAKDIGCLRAAALTLASGPRVRSLDVNAIYDLAAAQKTAITTDVPMADPSAVGLTGGRGKVIASYSGEEPAGFAGSLAFLPLKCEAEKSPALAARRERLERLAREANFRVMRGDWGAYFQRAYYVGRNENFMLRLIVAAPEAHAKLALDAELDFIPINEETSALYDESNQLDIYDLIVVAAPDWEKPETLFLGGAEGEYRDGRVLSVVDRENYAAYVLGGRTFGDIRECVLAMCAYLAESQNLGLFVRASSKTIILKDKKNAEKWTTFVTAGEPGIGKSTFGADDCDDFLDAQKGERVRFGADDAVVILVEPSNKKAGCAGLERGIYDRSVGYAPDCPYVKSVQSAENCMAAKDDDGRIYVIYEDVYGKNGRALSERKSLPGADECLDVPWPDYLSILHSDSTLPPLLKIEDNTLFAALFVSIGSEGGYASVVSASARAARVKTAAQTAGFKGLAVNCGFFDRGGGDKAKIGRELALSFYPALAKGEIKFEPYRLLPGALVPAKGAMEKLCKGYDAKFSFDAIKPKGEWAKLAAAALEKRIKNLRASGLNEEFVAPLLAALPRFEKEF